MSAARWAPRPLPRVLFIALAGIVLVSLTLLVEALTAKTPEFDQACRDGDPYAVTTSFRGQQSRSRPPEPRAPAVILFRDTAADSPQYVLATFRETGAVFGLAYRKSEPAVYAAAYHKRGLPYGPDGPGAVYRIDLATGAVSTFLQVPDAGSQQRGGFADGTFEFDSNAARFVGKTALGDIDFSEDESELYVMNLHDRRIYRYSMPAGTLLGSFMHGASGEAWAEDARPFGLAFHNGHLYHGVVNSRNQGGAFVAVVYRSNPDGTEMEQVGSLDLGYNREGVRMRTLRGSTKWSSWVDVSPRAPSEERPLDLPSAPPSQPMLTDIVFTDDDHMVLALRDRKWDVTLQWVESDMTVGPTVVSAHGVVRTPTPAPPQMLSETAIGFGDLILGQRSDTAWTFATDPEYFDDSNGIQYAESALGGLGWVPGTNTIVGSAYGVGDARSDLIIGQEGVYWYDVATGNQKSSEILGRPGHARPYAELIAEHVANADCTTEFYLDFSYHADVGSLGDVEVLCVPEVVPPTLTPEPTQPTPTTPPTVAVPPTQTVPPSLTVPPTNTNAPTVPPTPTVPTLTPTPRPGIAYLPILLDEPVCTVQYRFADVALVLDMSTTMRRTTEAGRAKYAAVIEAATSFVAMTRLEPTEIGQHDQIAVVGFNSRAWVEEPLGADRARVEQGLRDLPAKIAEGTRLDLAFAGGVQALDARLRRSDNQAVMILLTDGLPNKVPVAEDGTMETTVRRAAQAAKDAGISVYTIGVGKTDPGADLLDRIDAVLLTACATRPEMFFYRPSAEQLQGAYTQIIRRIDPCAGRHPWGVPWP